MTRKDYIAIAAAIRATQERIEATCEDRPTEWKSGQLRGVRRAAAHIADALKVDNPQGFDPALFLKNCGYGGSFPPESSEDQALRSRQAWADREETVRQPRIIDGEGEVRKGVARFETPYGVRCTECNQRLGSERNCPTCQMHNKVEDMAR